MSSMALSEQELIRRENLSKIIEAGINPYPSAEYNVTAYAKQIKAEYAEDKKEAYRSVTLAGRLMMKRIMGKASFAELQDSTGRIQIYVNRDEICPDEDKTLYNTVFKKLLDIGDFIGVTGHVFTTQTGETTVHVSDLTVLSKSLKPLPIVKTDSEGKIHDEVTDPEFRYRQRYADLVVNPGVKEAFIKRSKMYQSMRAFLNAKDYIEVETPILQPIYGGAAARPFKTHHNTLDMDLYLRIANELYLKRLIVGGFEGVYEFSKDFRNEGMSRFHNPEFTQIELYVAYKDYEWMMNLVEEMIEKVAIDVTGSTVVKVGDHNIDFKRPWKRYTMYGAIKEFTGVDISQLDETALRKIAKDLEVGLDASMARGKIIDEIFGEKCEPHLIQPTFITDYPIEMSPLAKKHRSEEGLVERFEAIRFEAQLELGKRGDDEAMVLDEDFLRALEYGMPPTAGVGIGMDRLAMIMTNSNSIQDVLFFPQMKPEAKKDKDESEG